MKKEGVYASFLRAIGNSVVPLIFLAVSVLVWMFANPLMELFVNEEETEIILEGAFYCGIGCLFLLYGLYRALGKPGMSLVLTIISLGTRVVLAYVLSAIPAYGVSGIWWSVPIGWFFADAVGAIYYLIQKKRLFSREK